ncbi:MAG TPA: DNA-directed RNA polymerase subunit omega [Anaerohalosphaeraceae bacterium]|jgi:DNA-directed RNA polymerase subunit omega|nr:DNA-directed RNA polymerase subunit omega [Anaerohalosphaeraceae bacterium]
MIEALKDGEVLSKVGGRFKLSSLIQKRMLEMMEGSRPLVENTEGMTAVEIVVEEIRQGKIALDLGGPAKPEKKFTL